MILLYTIVAALLGVYQIRLMALVLSTQAAKWESPLPLQGDALPSVTVQLPLHNERGSVRRLLRAVCTLDYPQACLEIHVLDDSTEAAARLLIRGEVARWQAQGVPITYYYRGHNTGYKAGNLAFGLEHAQGEFIAIFDADFTPQRGWLRQALAHFEGADDLGLVQMRWGHLNARDSWLTLAAALTVNYYSLAQAVRTRLGLWSSFYGSAGVWRKACIKAVGGWATDTLTEDLDLAYRAQLAGWRLGYDHTLLAAAEVPTRLIDYKRQQFRWAKGNLQVMRRLLPHLLARGRSPLTRLDALLFGTWAASHILTLLLLVLRLLLLSQPPGLWLTLVDLLVALGILGSLLPVPLGGKLTPPLHVPLGIGLSVNIAGGMASGLVERKLGAFHTTPKKGQARGRVPLHWSTGAELALSTLAVLGLVSAVRAGLWLLLPLFGLYALSFGWVGLTSVWEFLTSRTPEMSTA